MSCLDPIPYLGAASRDPAARQDHRDGRRLVQLEPAELRRNEVSPGQRLPVIPVNPGIAGETLLGERAYASLRDIPGPVDMVDVFCPARDAPAIVEDAIAIGAKVVWMQLGIRNDAASVVAEKAGIEVIMNGCPKNRVRPAGRRALMERGQQRHHP